MAKEKSADKVSKKDKKEKRSEKDGVHKTSKKDKKDKKSSASTVDTDVLVEHLDNEAAVNVTEAPSVLAAVPLGAFVPFANPLADEKVGKKVLKSVKKGESLLYSCIGRSCRSILVPTSCSSA